ncbi:phosphotransferase [Nocardia sp. R16R-3T]
MTDHVLQFEAKVRAAYTQEERAAGPVTGLDQLPFTYDHLTTAWLTKLLCHGHDGVEVVNFRAEEADDLGRGHARIWVEYRGDSDGLPRSVFCKDSQRLELRLFNAALIAGEVQFFKDIQPALGVETPRCRHVGYDPGTLNSLLIFDDLREYGLTFCTDKTSVTRTLAEGQICHLAAVHSRFWGEMDSNHLMQELRPFSNVYDSINTIFGGRFSYAVMNGFHAAAEALPDKVLSRTDDIWPGVERALGAQRDAQPTLTHNDSHIDNWYPSPDDGQLRLGDWQIVSRGDPAFDLALALSTSLTVEDRRAWERDLIKLYIEEVAARGGPHLTFDEAWDRYRTQLFLVLAWWTPTVKSSVDFEFHDLDGTFEIIHRIATALDDLDAFA